MPDPKPTHDQDTTPRHETNDPEATEERADQRVEDLQEAAGRGDQHAGGSPGDTPDPAKPVKGQPPQK